MKREIGDYIEDILEAMTNAMEFTKDCRIRSSLGKYGWNER